MAPRPPKRPLYAPATRIGPVKRATRKAHIATHTRPRLTWAISSRASCFSTSLSRSLFLLYFACSESSSYDSATRLVLSTSERPRPVCVLAIAAVDPIVHRNSRPDSRIMSTAVRRQRASTRNKAVPPRQPAPNDITTFTRVSKSVGSSGPKKDILSTPTKDRKFSAPTPASRKRKVVPASDDDSSADEKTPVKAVLPLALSKNAFDTPVKRGRGRPPKKTRPTPASLKRVRSPSISDSEESATNTDKLFKRLRLESSPSRCSSPLTANTSIADSEAESDIELTPALILPNEVLSLIDLHTAFLKTLTLHFAHNGTTVPADLRTLCPNIARSWGKKAVSEADLRLCVGIQNLDVKRELFSLSNYGRGKICLEVDAAQVSGPLREKQLNVDFRNKLERLWTRFASRGDRDAARFLDSLPKAAVDVCGSVAKASPIVAQGQKRLEELKQGIAVKKLEKENKPAADSPPTKPDGPKLSLLDRIRQKQLQKASMPSGLTPAQRERIAALQRVSEVASLIGMLSRATAGGQGRISFTMAVMVEKLKDSFKMGISKDEGVVCVRLLAHEVAPEWIRVVTIGQRENVVVETGRQMSKAEVERRIHDVSRT